jgi:apolipoprotein N-acyltransferase
MAKPRQPKTMSWAELRPTLGRVTLAIGGGVLSSLAYPREGLWPMIFLAVIALLVSVRGLGFGKAFWVGYVGGFFFYVSQIEWMSLYLGPVPLLALSILEAFFFGLGMAAIAMIWRWLEAKPNLRLRGIQVSLAIATIWTAREWVSTNLPYGGFPWSRLAMSQSESPLANWVYFGGQPLLTFVIALICALGVSWAIEVRRSGWRTAASAYSIALTVILFALPASTKLPSNAEHGSLVIAAVQGNANAGLFANAERGSILRNHLEATKLIPNKASGKKIDLVVWPENASDINPLGDAAAGDTIRRLVDDKLGVPLIFGTITRRGDDLYNSSIFWQPGVGATDWYDKKRPVPFAEYVPDHDFWYSLAPELIGMISHGYTFGTRDGIFELGDKPLGVLICFEIAIDDISRDLVQSGAQVILSQTNNSDFGHSDETFQQVAIAKLRAIETGRAVVNDSTVGVSAVFGPDGTVLDHLPTFEPGVMVTKVPLRTSITPAMAIGSSLDLGLNLAATILIALSIGRKPLRRLLSIGRTKSANSAKLGKKKAPSNG